MYMHFLGFVFACFFKERESVDWMGREMVRMWKELREVKNVIRIYCMKTLFFNNKKKRMGEKTWHRETN